MCACVWVVSPIVSHCPSHVCVPVLASRGLVSPCLPLSPMVSPHVCLCWMVCPPSRGLPLSPLVSHCVPLSPRMCACVGRCVRLPGVLSPLVSPHVACVGWCVGLPGVLSPLVSPHTCACVGWRVRLPNPHVCLCWMVPPPSRGLASPCVPSCPPGLPLSLLVSLCWMVCLPEALSPLSPSLSPSLSGCLPSCFSLVSAFPGPCLPCLPY